MPTLFRLSVFFTLACALTWFGIAGNAIWPSDIWPQPMNPLGPLLAAPIAILLTDGRAGLRAWGARLIGFRAPAWVYLTALAGPLLIIVASVALAALSGAVIRPLPALDPIDFVLAIPLVLIMGGPVGEELAFRGLAQHELQRQMTPLIAALIIGVGVVIWHAPLVMAGEIGWPMAICIVAVSVVYAWLYRMGGSVWPLVVLHFSVNYFGPNYFGSMLADPQGQFVYRLFFVAFYVIWAGWIAWRFGPRLTGRIRPQSAATAPVS